MSYTYHDERTKESAASLNAQFQEGISTQYGREKVSALHENQIAHYLREHCILDQALPPSDISAAECEPGPETDTLFKKVYLQMETRAYVSTFESMPREVQELYVPRFYMSFLMLSTPTYVANDYNMMAYPFPVPKQVEDNIGADLHEAKDWVMLDRLEAAIQASRARYGNVLRGVQAQADIEANGNNTGFRGQIEREDLMNMKKYFAGTRSRVAHFVIPETDYIDLERFDLSDFGDNLVASVFMNGLDTDRVHGVKMIRTIKIDASRGDVFRTGNIYAFPEPEYLGRNYTLRGVKFYLERDHQWLYFDAQMAFGFIWAVASRLCKLELYNGGRDLAGNVIAGGAPTSDALFGSTEAVTSKDYFDFSLGLRQPNIRFN